MLLCSCAFVSDIQWLNTGTLIPRDYIFCGKSVDCYQMLSSQTSCFNNNTWGTQYLAANSIPKCVLEDRYMIALLFLIYPF